MKLAHYSEEADKEDLDDVDACEHGIVLPPIHDKETCSGTEIVDFFNMKTENGVFSDSVMFEGRVCQANGCGKEVLNWEDKQVQQYISTMHRIYSVAKKNRPSFDSDKFKLLLKSDTHFNAIDNDPNRRWTNLTRKVNSLLIKKIPLAEVFKGLHGDEEPVPEAFLQEGSKA